jgi:hypothetical protein
VGPVYVRPVPPPERRDAQWHSLGRVPYEGWDSKCGVHWRSSTPLEFSDKLPFGSPLCPKCVEIEKATE